MQEEESNNQSRSSNQYYSNWSQSLENIHQDVLEDQQLEKDKMEQEKLEEQLQKNLQELEDWNVRQESLKVGRGKLGEFFPENVLEEEKESKSDKDKDDVSGNYSSINTSLLSQQQQYEAMQWTQVQQEEEERLRNDKHYQASERMNKHYGPDQQEKDNYETALANMFQKEKDNIWSKQMISENQDMVSEERVADKLEMVLDKDDLVLDLKINTMEQTLQTEQQNRTKANGINASECKNQQTIPKIPKSQGYTSNRINIQKEVMWRNIEDLDNEVIRICSNPNFIKWIQKLNNLVVKV